MCRNINDEILANALLDRLLFDVKSSSLPTVATG